MTPGFPYLQIRTAEGLTIVLVNEGGTYKVCLAGEGIRVFGHITPWEARRAAHFLEGDVSEASRPLPPLERRDEVTAVGLRPKLRADTEPGDEF